MSMDASGKIIWAKHSEIQQANIKAMADQEVKDGERLSLAVKDMGSCEIYPQTIQHNPNGRLVPLHVRPRKSFENSVFQISSHLVLVDQISFSS